MKNQEIILWIDVNEKLPNEIKDDCRTVLIMCDYVGRPSVGYFDGDIWHIAETGITTRRRNIGCTHWAEMPTFK